MHNPPNITIIVPLYNKEKFVKRSLDAILSQSYEHFEVLVVNDGSTDTSKDVVLNVDDPRIRLIEKQNAGVSSARNRGLDEAKGTFVVFLDADDEWHEKHLEVLVEGFESYPDAVMLSNTLEYCWGIEQKDSMEVAKFHTYNGTVLWKQEHYLHSLSQGKFPIHICSTIFRRALLEEKHIRFYEHMRLAEDVNFMLRVSRFGHCMLSDYLGFIYHQDDQHSAMKQQDQTAALVVPHYFEKMDEEEWSEEEKKYIRKFLLREYIKKAYQNRHMIFRQEELSINLGGNTLSLSKISLIFYITVRFMPEFLFKIYRRLKS